MSDEELGPAEQRERRARRFAGAALALAVASVIALRVRWAHRGDLVDQCDALIGTIDEIVLSGKNAMETPSPASHARLAEAYEIGDERLARLPLKHPELVQEAEEYRALCRDVAASARAASVARASGDKEKARAAHEAYGRSRKVEVALVARIDATCKR